MPLFAVINRSIYLSDYPLLLVTKVLRYMISSVGNKLAILICFSYCILDSNSGFLRSWSLLCPCAKNLLPLNLSKWHIFQRKLRSFASNCWISMACYYAWKVLVNNLITRKVFFGYWLLDLYQTNNPSSNFDSLELYF